MRVKSTSKYYHIDRIRELLTFAAKGVRDSAVEVHVKNGRDVAGMAYGWPLPTFVNVAKSTRYLITIRLPEPAKLIKRTRSGIVGIDKLWPDGIPLDDWEDVLVDIAAHEFRHIWQYQREERTGKKGKGEYDADKHAMKMLNRWRQETGREPVEPVKQDNPFANVKKVAAKVAEPKEATVRVLFLTSERRFLEEVLRNAIDYYDFALANRRKNFYPTDDLAAKRERTEKLLQKLLTQ